MYGVRCGIELHLCVLKTLTGTIIASNLKSAPLLAKFDFGNETQPVADLVFSLKISAFIQIVPTPMT